MLALWLQGAAASPARAADVARFGGVSVTTTNGATAVEFRVDGDFSHSTFSLSSPARFVCDLEGVVLDGPREVAGHGPVARVRLGQYVALPRPVARLVVDLNRPLLPEIEELGSGLRLRFGASPPPPLPRETATPTASTRRVEPEPVPAREAASRGVVVRPPLAVELALSAAAGEAAPARVRVAEPIPVAAVPETLRTEPRPPAARDGGERSSWLVRSDGQRVEVAGTWRRDGDRVIYTDRSGNLISLRAEAVDFEATEALAVRAAEERSVEMARGAAGD